MARQRLSLISRPLAGWIGGGVFAVQAAEDVDLSRGDRRRLLLTSHSTSSLHGGVVSEPM
jgi:hypothetical protein